MALAKEKEEEINSLYLACGGNVAKAVERLSFPISITTVRNYWKKAGFKPGPRGGRRVSRKENGSGSYSDEEIKEICSTYEMFKGNSKEASQYLKRQHKHLREYYPNTLRKIWIVHGLVKANTTKGRPKKPGLEGKVA